MRRPILDRKCIVAIFAVLCFGFLTAAAEAFIIDYQFSGTGVYGDVAGVAFNDATFLISISGDTNNVILTDPAGPIINNLAGTMTLSGGDLLSSFSGNFTGPLYVFVDPSVQLVGFGTGSPPDGDLLDFSIPTIATYDLTTLFGPFSATGILNFFDTNLTFGALAIEQIDQGSFAAVPVPAPVLLLASGLIGLVGIRRRYKE